MAENPALVCVAIDFGTTYSGYAFSTKGDFELDPTKIYANEEWPAGNVGFSRKAPTVLLLNPDGDFEAFGFEAEEMYTQLAVGKDHEEWYYFRRFKMKLHGEKDIGKDMIIEDETGKKYKAANVFTESIKYLKQHFLDMLNKQGKLFKESEIQYVLTVPAIWNDPAKQFMRNAAEKAGIDGRRLRIALEPEAAAFYCQYEKTERSTYTFASAGIGTIYMVIDLGGGTVDIALHKKLENGMIQELYQASGGAFGGTAVDEAYIQLLTRALGGPTMYQFRKENTCDFLDMMREFEVAKRNLKPSGNLAFNTRIPVSLGHCCKQQNEESLEDLLSARNFPFKGKIKIIGDKISVQADMMREIFASVTTKITDHVQEILSTPAADDCQILLLVGGFAESSLVQKAIKDKFETNERRVIVPAESGLTVVKGATIFGHKGDSGLVAERVIRYNYGIEVLEDFDEDIDDPRYKIDRSDQPLVRLFSKFMKKGTSMKIGTVVRKQYHFERFSDDSTVIVYSTARKVRYVDRGGLEKLLDINVSGDAKKFYGRRVDVDVSFTFGGTEIKIEVHCIQTGHTFEAKVANYS